MLQLNGEYDCKLDAKGRLKLPVGLLRQIPSQGAYTFVLNRGFEKCLMLYPLEVWNQRIQEINRLNIYNPRERQFMRYFQRGATQVVTDSAERVLIPRGLQEHAALEKDVVVFAWSQQVEIWNRTEYKKMIDQEPVDFSAIAAEVFGNRAEEQ